MATWRAFSKSIAKPLLSVSARERVRDSIGLKYLPCSADAFGKQRARGYYTRRAKPVEVYGGGRGALNAQYRRRRGVDSDVGPIVFEGRVCSRNDVRQEENRRDENGGKKNPFFFRELIREILRRAGFSTAFHPKRNRGRKTPYDR